MAEQPETAKQLDLADYLRIARRRFAYWAAPFLALSVAAVSAVLLLPPVYRSTGTVAVESQRIPEELVRSTVRGSADQRIGFVKQLVMTDKRLTGIILEFGLYQDILAEPHVKLAVDKLRENVTVAAVRDPYSSAATIAFTVSFDHPEARTAMEVANQLVELFLEENTKTRNARASETAAFLRQQANRLKDEVRGLDQEVAEFKRLNSDALPEHLSMRVSMLQQIGFDIRSVQREITSTEQERRFLQTQLNDASSRYAKMAADGQAGMTREQLLQKLELDLAAAKASYTPAHPDVVRLRRMVREAAAELENVNASKSSDGTDPSRGERFSDLDAKLTANEVRLESLREYERQLSARMAELQSQILRTPHVEQGLRDIDFRYERASGEYSEIRAKLQEAELAENLESEELAERFILLESPTVPLKPERPNRLKLIALGLAGAMCAGLALVFAVELLDGRIRDPKTLGAVMGTPTFAILPYIERPKEGTSRALVISGMWLSFAALLGLAFLFGQAHSAALAEILGGLYY